MPDKTPITAYKAFDDDFTCRDYQFEVGQTYEHDGPVSICESGFHACLNPLDCLRYYDLTTSRFAEVVVDGDTDTHDDDTKLCAEKITIKAELKLPDFIDRAVSWLLDAAKSCGDRVQAASRNYSQLAASGDSSQLAASGDSSQLAASGNYSRLAASGERSVIASSAINATAKGAAGTWISLAEFDDERHCIGFATGCVGQDGIEPDTWYRAKGGKLVAVY